MSNAAGAFPEPDVSSAAKRDQRQPVRVRLADDARQLIDRPRNDHRTRFHAVDRIPCAQRPIRICEQPNRTHKFLDPSTVTT